MRVEFGRAFADGDFEAGVGVNIFYVGLGEYAREFGEQFFNHRRGRAGGRQQPVPADDFEPGHGLIYCRDVRHRGVAAGIADRKQAQAARFYMRQQRAGRRDYEIDAPREQVHRVLRTTLVSNVHHLDSGHGRQQFSGEMRRTADAG